MKQLVLVTAVVMAGCATAPPADDARTQATSEPKTPPLAAVSFPYPATRGDRPTTSSSIYLANLNGQIESLQKGQGASDPAKLQHELAARLYHRFKIIGRIEDLEAAQRAIDKALALAPESSEVLVLGATIASGTHRFADAEALLERAAHSGTKSETLAAMQREIDLALGRYERPLAWASAPPSPTENTLYDFAARAHIRALSGDLQGASQLYAEAQLLDLDVNPVPLSWLHVQQGILLLEAGFVAEAQTFFAAARGRLSEFYLATEHLAETELALGRCEQALELYREVTAQTGNPEFAAQLAKAERQCGDPELAAHADVKAEDGFAKLVATRPVFAGHHAVEFYLERGDLAQARKLAHGDLAMRRSIESLLLAAQVEHAARADEAACRLLREAAATGLRPPTLTTAIAEQPGCRL